jgi:hypothetical protein
VSIWAEIGKGVLTIAGGWLKDKATVREAELRAKIAVIESKARIEEARATAYIQLAASAQDHEQAWERLAAEQAATSWKDEFWTILLAIPVAGAFVPGLQGYITRGFTYLDTVPDWYLAAVGVAVAFAFGYRKLVPMLGKKSNK